MIARRHPRRADRTDRDDAGRGVTPAARPQERATAAAVTELMKRVLFALLFVAILLPAAVSRSGATFVAATNNPGAQFVAAARLQHRLGLADQPGLAAARVRAGHRRRRVESRHRLRRLLESRPPARAPGRWPAPRRSRPTPARSTRPRSPTGCATCARSPPTAPATRAPTRSRTAASTTPRRPRRRPTRARRSPARVNVDQHGDRHRAPASRRHTIQYRATAGAWTDICTAATSPLTCSWNTTGSPTGSTTCARSPPTSPATARFRPVSNRRVDNTAPTVSLTDPGAPREGHASRSPSTTADGAGSGVSSVRYQYKLDLGLDLDHGLHERERRRSRARSTRPRSPTTVYDFRAVATDGVAKATTSTALTVAPDRQHGADGGHARPRSPSPLQNTVALTGTATDPSSGIAYVRFQYAPDRHRHLDRHLHGPEQALHLLVRHDRPRRRPLRHARARDRPRRQHDASATQTPHARQQRPDDDAHEPVAGAYVRGTINITATATDVSGVTSVEIQYRLVARRTWTTLCTDTITPYSCAAEHDDARRAARPTRSGSSAPTRWPRRRRPRRSPSRSTTSRPSGDRRPGANGGTARHARRRRPLTFSYSEPMLPASILAGWRRQPRRPVTMRVTNVGAADTLEVYDAANTTHQRDLAGPGAVGLDADYVSTNATFNGDDACASATRRRHRRRVHLRAPVSTGAKKADHDLDARRPSATDLAGNAVTAAARHRGRRERPRLLGRDRPVAGGAAGRSPAARRSRRRRAPA